MQEIVVQPWDKRPWETDTAYNAFCEYLRIEKRGSRTKDGKPRRFLQDLARVIKKTVQTLNAWSIKYEWEERAASYDLYISGPGKIAAIEAVALARNEYAEEIRDAGELFR